jgi:hypothetical protein
MDQVGKVILITNYLRIQFLLSMAIQEVKEISMHSWKYLGKTLNSSALYT